MRRSSLLLIATLMLGMASGCAAHKPARPSAPVTEQRGSLTLVRGLSTTTVTLPANFVARPGFAPLWMNEDATVAVAGELGGKTVLLALGGTGFKNQQELAADVAGGDQPSRVLDAAPSPDTFALALAIAYPQQKRVVVNLRDLLGRGETYTLATLDGDFDSAQLIWLDDFSLALLLPPGSSGDPGTLELASSRAGLYLIAATSTPGIRQLARLGCAPQHLDFSPNGERAVAIEAVGAPAAVVSLDDQTCHALKVHSPFQVLAWAPDSSAFLFLADGAGGIPGVFRYELGSGRVTLVAVASGAAAYANDGSVIALGDSWLTWQRAEASPDKLLDVQVALWQRGTQQVTINPVGVATTPQLLARSRMLFSIAADTGLIDIVVRNGDGFRRELIEYSYARRAAFPLVAADVNAQLGVSWAPDGKALAVVDSGARPNLLSVIRPPR